MELKVKIEDVSGRIVRARYPSVVMAMPGCADRLVNEAHRHVFGDSDVDCVQSAAECQRVLESVLSIQPSAITSAKCYCEKAATKGAVAIRRSLCAFESMFLQLTQQGEEWSSRISFLGLKQREGARTYDVFQVHSRLLACSSEGGYMESVLMPLGHSAVISAVDSPIKRASPPTSLKVSIVSAEQKPVLEETFKVPRDEDYDWFFEVLSDSVMQLTSGKQKSEVKQTVVGKVQHRIRFNPQKFYEPLEGYVECLFSERDCHVLIHHIQKDQDRLFDALVLMNLNDRLDKELLIELVERLPIKFQEVVIPLMRTARGGKVEEMPFAVGPFSQSTKNRGSETLVSSAPDSGGTGIASLGDIESMNPSRNKFNKSSQQGAQGQKDDFKREWATFERLLPELLSTHRGWFVAICEGKLIDKDKDQSALAKRVWRKTEKFILIERIMLNAGAPWHLSTPCES
jgi:hypothetical protein